MSFTHCVLRQSAKPVRGPRVTCVSTHDSEQEALDAANKELAASSDTFYVCCVVATTTKVVQVVRREPPEPTTLPGPGETRA